MRVSRVHAKRKATACFPGVRTGASTASPRSDDAPARAASPTVSSDLPEPAQIEVLPALRADPPGRGRRFDDVAVAQRLAGQRAQDHDDQRAEQHARELALMTRLLARDHRRQEDPDCQICRGDEEQAQLEVPGSRQLIRKPLRDVETEEVTRLRVIVGVGGPTEPLKQNSPVTTRKNQTVDCCPGVRRTSLGSRKLSHEPRLVHRRANRGS